MTSRSRVALNLAREVQRVPLGETPGDMPLLYERQTRTVSVLWIWFFAFRPDHYNSAAAAFHARRASS